MRYPVLFFIITLGVAALAACGDTPRAVLRGASASAAGDTLPAMFNSRNTTRGREGCGGVFFQATNLAMRIKSPKKRILHEDRKTV